ncbi:MaoC/PaaZ C-terminal domain-containing protein [soil metagenome]
MHVGDVISWQRTFTEEEIRAFARLSGDEGEHHLVPDGHGRLIAHGLLTATLPTKIGGDMNFIARLMTFEFHRPVFAGDTIQCEVTLVELEPGDEYNRVAAQYVCRNQNGKEVMKGQARGVIRNT